VELPLEKLQRQKGTVTLYCPFGERGVKKRRGPLFARQLFVFVV
jgi:hypothetical protein